MAKTKFVSLLRGGRADGAGSGQASDGAVLKQGNDGSLGLFIFGPKTDPSWHLRGVERQIEEAAVRASLTFPGAGGSQSLVLRFGDTARDDNRYKAHTAYPYALPETVNRDVINYAQHPDPSSRQASHEVNDQLTVRAALAGVPGNALRLLVREGLGGRSLRFSDLVYLDATDPDDSSRTGNTLQIRINSDDAEDYNGATVSVASAVATAARANNINLAGSSSGNRQLNVVYNTAGTAGNGFEVNFSALAGGSASAAAAASYASATRLNVTWGVNSGASINSIVAAINAARHNGSQLVTASRSSNTDAFAVAGSLGGSSVLATLAGGGAAVNRVAWTDNGSSSTLIIYTDGTYNVTAIAAAINAISDFPGTAAVFGSGRADWLIDEPQASHTFSGAQNARARTPLAVGESVANSVRTLSITGVVPGTDTIANLIAAYTDSTKHYEIVGTGTDFAILAADAQGNNDVLFNGALSGGRAALTRQDTTVDVISRNLNTGAVTYRVTIYGSNSPLAHRTTLNELIAAWRTEIRTTLGDLPAFSLSGDGTDQLDVSSLPATPTGGRNYVPPSPIEFLVRDEDEADGKNIEVRYHADHDTLQEILDASMVSAQNPGGAEVIELFGTDLTEEPEEPPFSRRMYPEAGTGQAASFVPSKVNLFAAIKAIFHPATNDLVSADDPNSELDVALPEASETEIGGVRNVSIDEAAAPDGTVFRAWSSAMITKLIAVWRTVVPRDEAEAGTSTVPRFWTAQRVHQAILALAPGGGGGGADAVARAATATNAAAIEALETLIGEGSLIREEFAGMTGATVAEERVPDVTVADEANAGYVLRVEGVTEFQLGNALRAARANTAIAVNGVNFYSNSQGHLLLTKDAAAISNIAVWVVRDIAAIRAAIAAAGSGSLTVEDEGNALATPATRLNFVGAGVTVTGTGAEKTITIPGGGGTTPPAGTHNRLIGWSAAAQPTSAEVAAASIETDDELLIPSRNTNGYLFFGVASTADDPTAAFYDGNTHDILGGFDKRANRSRSGTAYKLWSTSAAQSAAILGTGTRTLTLSYATR